MNYSLPAQYKLIIITLGQIMYIFHGCKLAKSVFVTCNSFYFIPYGYGYSLPKTTWGRLVKGVLYTFHIVRSFTFCSYFYWHSTRRKSADGYRTKITKFRCCFVLDLWCSTDRMIPQQIKWWPMRWESTKREQRSELLHPASMARWKPGLTMACASCVPNPPVHTLHRSNILLLKAPKIPK